jgi:hypothetical protein
MAEARNEALLIMFDLLSCLKYFRKIIYFVMISFSIEEISNITSNFE